MTTQNTQNGDSDITVVEQQPVSKTGTETNATPTPVDEDTSSAGPSTGKEDEVVRPFTDFIEEFRQTEVRRGSSTQEPQVEPFSSLLFTEETSGSSAPSPWENTLLESPLPSVESVGAEAPQTSTEEAVETTSIGETQGDAPISSVQTKEQVASSEQAITEPEVPAAPAIQTPSTPPAERPVSPLLRPARHLRLPRHGGRQRDAAASAANAQVPQSSSPAGKTVEVSQASPAQNLESVPTATPNTAAPAESPVLSPTDETSAVPQAELAPLKEQPKPARRYRFDRPAPTPAASPSAPGTSGVPAASAQTRVEENKDVLSHTSSTSVRGDEAQIGERETSTFQQKQVTTNGTQVSEPKQASTQEASATNGGGASVPTATSVPTPSMSAQDRRRRHGQDRQHEKEKAATPVPPPTTPVVEVAPPVTEPVAPLAPEVVLEDLPPLEYSELQAASSRRRRRRRSGASTTSTPLTAKPAAPDLPPTATPLVGNVTPMPSATSPVAVPRNVAPNTAASQAQYTIVSGYTVNQINQGSEGAGPFMGPEPSPARGSTNVRGDSRSLRTEAQRAPSYPIRTGEHSGASINHLANVIAQTISAQTDRMVAELRHANQSPTNVSVSLPPFPSTERVGVFVDVANLLYSARTLRMTIDFGKLLDFLRGNRRLVRAQAYCPTSPQPGDEQMFLQAVKGLGYRITTKNYKTFSSGAKKADMDLDLCMDVVRLVDGRAVDCIVLVSGDSDFMPLLDYCSDHGVRVEVAAFDESMSATLRQSCDLFINLSMLDEIRA